MVDKVVLGSDQSSVMHLQDYRNQLMTRMSRDDVMSQLKIIHAPEIYSDPPEFNLNEYIYPLNQDLPQKVIDMVINWEQTLKPIRGKA